MDNNTVIAIIWIVLIAAFIPAYVHNKKLDKEIAEMNSKIIEALKKQNLELNKLANKIKEN